VIELLALSERTWELYGLFFEGFSEAFYCFYSWAAPAVSCIGKLSNLFMGWMIQLILLFLPFGVESQHLYLDSSLFTSTPKNLDSQF